MSGGNWLMWLNKSLWKAQGRRATYAGLQLGGLTYSERSFDWKQLQDSQTQDSEVIRCEVQGSADSESRVAWTCHNFHATAAVFASDLTELGQLNQSAGQQ